MLRDPPSITHRQLRDRVSITRAALLAADAAVDLGLYRASFGYLWPGNRLCEFAKVCLNQGEILNLLWGLVAANLDTGVVNESLFKALDIILYGFYAKNEELQKFLLQRLEAIMEDLVGAAADGGPLDVKNPFRLQIAKALVKSRRMIIYSRGAPSQKLDIIEGLLADYNAEQARKAVELEKAIRGAPKGAVSGGLLLSSGNREDMDVMDGVVMSKNKSVVQPDSQTKTPGVAAATAAGTALVKPAPKPGHPTQKSNSDTPKCKRMENLELMKKALAQKKAMEAQAAALNTSNVAGPGLSTDEGKCGANAPKADDNSNNIPAAPQSRAFSVNDPPLAPNAAPVEIPPASDRPNKESTLPQAVERDPEEPTNTSKIMKSYAEAVSGRKHILEQLTPRRPPPPPPKSLLQSTHLASQIAPSDLPIKRKGAYLTSADPHDARPTAASTPQKKQQLNDYAVSEMRQQAEEQAQRICSQAIENITAPCVSSFAMSGPSMRYSNIISPPQAVQAPATIASLGDDANIHQPGTAFPNPLPAFAPQYLNFSGVNNQAAELYSHPLADTLTSFNSDYNAAGIQSSQNTPKQFTPRCTEEIL